jgi:two-component system NarL family sensor kinase
MNDNEFILFIVISVAIMLVFALGLIIFFSTSQKKIQSEKLANQQIKIDFQKELLESIIQTQEKERDRIARELHDDVGSKLNVIHLNLHLLKKAISKGQDTEQILDHIRTSLDESIQTSRDISHELMPPVLSKFGIHSAIEDLENAINRTGVFKLSINSEVDWQLKDDMHQLHLFRIVQELVQNALKHSKAKMVDINFEKKDNLLYLNYLDDGVGFPKEVEAKGLGLNNLETRVQVLEGSWQINRSKLKGAEINIKIPLYE